MTTADLERLALDYYAETGSWPKRIVCAPLAVVDLVGMLPGHVACPLTIAGAPVEPDPKCPPGHFYADAG